MNTSIRFIAAFVAGIVTAGAFAAEEETITIKTLRAQMRYDTTDIEVRPGQKVKILFQNEDDMPHNLCFFQPGTDVIDAANRQMEKPEEAMKRNWIPVDARMWLHSKPLNPKESEMIEFTAPEKPGVYPYVCTFPGHAAIMNGRLKVAALGKGLTDLKFRLYLGDWKTMPKFPDLKVHREGVIEDNLIQLKLDDYKNEFAVIFTGKLNAPRDGEYVFQLASDDGARVLVDGQKVVDNDGIHPATAIKEGSVKLKKGEHEYRLQYFQAAGQAELFAAWRGPDFANTPLSKWLHPNWKSDAIKKKKKKTESTGMPLVVGGEPLIYRNFITGAGNRAIAVGFPGNASIAWSAESMNLALAWRGAFIDAAQHWNSRGGGYQPPLGFDVFRPAELSPPFAVLANGASWPVVGKGGRVEGYTWRGYELDVKRQPIFHYDWEGVKVSDRFEVTGDALATGKIVRTLTLDGKIPAGALFRVASAAKITPQGDGFLVEGGRFTPEIATDCKFLVSAEGAAFHGRDLTLPVRPEIKVTYWWPDLHMQHAGQIPSK